MAAAQGAESRDEDEDSDEDNPWHGVADPLPRWPRATEQPAEVSRELCSEFMELYLLGFPSRPVAIATAPQPPVHKEGMPEGFLPQPEREDQVPGDPSRGRAQTLDRDCVEETKQC